MPDVHAHNTFENPNAVQPRNEQVTRRRRRYFFSLCACFRDSFADRTRLRVVKSVSTGRNYVLGRALASVTRGVGNHCRSQAKPALER